MVKLLLTIWVPFILVSCSLSDEKMMTEKEQQLLEELNQDIRPGDIVFISIPNALYRRVAQTTNSWTSHVGFVYGKENDDWLIAESSFPLSRKCTLTKFLKRSENGQISVNRLDHDLSSENIEQLRQSADKRMGIFYHTGFKYHSSRQFCSKFVHEIYKEALDIEIGYLETFEQLLNKTDDAPCSFGDCGILALSPGIAKPSPLLHSTSQRNS